MRRKLETNLVTLKEKLAEIDKKAGEEPDSKYLKEIRESYMRAIRAAESTLNLVNDLDPTVLNTVAKLKDTQAK
jgi:hypothetical protein